MLRLAALVVLLLLTAFPAGIPLGAVIVLIGGPILLTVVYAMGLFVLARILVARRVGVAHHEPIA